MQATNNPVDIDLFSELQMQGDSEVQSKAVTSNPQLSFIQKCIHPPSALPGYCGIPTNDARSQTCIEWRRMNINATPRIFDKTTSKVREVLPADLTQFDYCYLHLNGARVMSVPFIYNKTYGYMAQDYANVQTISQYNWANWIDDANLFRVVYKSSTHTLNATMFNDTGMVVGNQFNPSILFGGSFIRFAEEKPAYFRKMVKQLYDKGRLNITADPIEKVNYETFPKHVRDDISEICSLKSGQSLNLDPNTAIQILNLSAVNLSIDGGDVTPTNDSILQQSLRSYGGKAIDGAFAVQRLNTIAPKWNTASQTPIGTAQVIPGLYWCYVFTVGSDGSEHFVPLSENAPIDATPATLQDLQDTLWSSDMTMSWVRFSGLSLNQQTSVSTQLMMLKQYIGLEVQPSSVSAWAAMMRLGPKPDLQSMQALMDGFYELKDVLPAKYNFWGALGSIAAQGLKTFGSSVLDSLMKSGGSSSKSKSKKEKPVKEAKEVRDVDHKTDALNKKVDMLLQAFNRNLGNKGNSRQYVERRNQRPRNTNNRGGNRSQSAPVVLPPAQLNQNAMPPRRSRPRHANRNKVQ